MNIGSFFSINDLRGISLLFPIVAYFFSKENKVFFKKALFAYFAVSIVTELINNFSFSRYPEVYFWYGLFFAIFKIFLFSLIFYKLYSSPFLKKVAIFSFCSFCIFLLLFFLYSNTSNDYNKLPSSVQGIVLLILSLLYFYEKVKNPDTLFVYSLPEFWAITAVFLYASGTFFIYIFAEFWLQNETYLDDYTFIHSSISILENLLIAFSIWKKESTNNFTSLKSNIYI